MNTLVRCTKWFKLKKPAYNYLNYICGALHPEVGSLRIIYGTFGPVQQGNCDNQIEQDGIYVAYKNNYNVTDESVDVKVQHQLDVMTKERYNEYRLANEHEIKKYEELRKFYKK